MRFVPLVIAVLCFLIATITAFGGGSLLGQGPIGWDSAGLLAYACAAFPWPSFVVRRGA